MTEALGGVTIKDLYLKAQKASANVIGATTDATVERTVEGASTLTLNIRDSQKVLLKSGLFSQRITATIDRHGFELVAVNKAALDLTVVFEDAAVAALRKQTKPIKVAAGTMSRVDFARMLLKEVPWIKLEVAPVPVQKTKVELTRGTFEAAQTDSAAGTSDTFAATGSSTDASAPDVERILATIRQKESATAGLYAARNPHSTASGAYQFTDGTWGNFGGYARAVLAPPAVQDDKARQNVRAILAKYGNVLESVPAAWYVGHYPGKGKLNFVPGGPGNGGKSVQQYVNEWLEIYQSLPAGGGGGTSTAAAPSAGGATVTEVEDTWTCLGRIFEEVGWRRYMRNGALVIAPDAFALLFEPAATLVEHENGVDGIDFQYDVGKPVAEVTVTCRAERWGLPPGSCVAVEGQGPADGRYLVTTISRSLFRTSASVTLAKPQPTLPEPEPESTGEDGAGAGGSGGEASGQVVTGDRTSARGFIWPLEGKLGAPFGKKGHAGTDGRAHTHGGQDISVAVGTPVKAVKAGVVSIASGGHGGYGNLVEVNHGDGVTSRYAHVSVIQTAVGQQVQQGQVIALSGGARGAAGSGNSTGAHLHFEIRVGGAGVNPLDYLP